MTSATRPRDHQLTIPPVRYVTFRYVTLRYVNQRAFDKKAKQALNKQQATKKARSARQSTPLRWFGGVGG